MGLQGLKLERAILPVNSGMISVTALRCFITRSDVLLSKFSVLGLRYNQILKPQKSTVYQIFCLLSDFLCDSSPKWMRTSCGKNPFIFVPKIEHDNGFPFQAKAQREMLVA